MSDVSLDLVLLCVSPCEDPQPDFILNAKFASSLAACLKLLANCSSCDAILIGLDITDTLPVHAVRRLAEAFPEIALIVCAHAHEEAEALKLVDAGATDYILPDAMDEANQKSRIEYAIQRHAARSLFRLAFEERDCKPARTWDWAFELGPDLTFKWLSDGFASRLQLAPDLLLGRTPWEIDVVEHDPDRWRQYIKDFSEHKPFTSLTCRLRDHQGGRHALRLWGDPVTAPDGSFLGYVGTGIDITAEVENAARLNDAYELLKDMFDDMQTYRERLEEDLEVARISQRELLPKPEMLAEIEEQCHVRLTYFFEPTSELGGDIWGVVPLNNGCFTLYLADFSGHGVAAALNTFRLTTLIQENHENRGEPAHYLEALNSRLKETLPTGQYATMLYGVVDTKSGTFRYAAAAAPRPLVADLKTGDIAAGEGRGLPLGAVSGARYTERCLQIKPGSLIMLASDALAESVNREGASLGKEGIVDLLRSVVLDKQEKVDAGNLLVPFFAKVDRPLKDDLTVVICQIPAFS
ncbi:MAG: SpoIIE family protein phosphatase [Alphaproteobacteria bacterium]|nr:SpoIIE family protein phosphatase [Alphaproteobacteria bacterium]